MNDEIRAWLQVIAAIGASLAALVGAIVAYRRFIKENATPKRESKEERLTIFSTQDQRTELVASASGLDLFLYDVRPNKPKGIQWSMTVDELRDALYKGDISVDPDYDDHPEWGLVDIGSDHTDWLYSKSLMGNPKQVHDKVMGLMKKATEMSKEKA